ncbi:MAG: helix-turn-helix domain-containing protein [Bacillus sp. (in: firmicutes)]
MLDTLEITNGNKQEAAKLLGIGKTSFYEKCKLYAIT